MIGFFLYKTNFINQYKNYYNEQMKIFPPTPVMSLETNQQFINSIGINIEMNSGLTLERQPFLTVIKGPTPSPNDISYIVYNHTKESIVFQDQAYNLQIFTFDTSNQKWVKLELEKAAKIKTVLPANLVTYRSDINNEWVLPHKLFEPLDFRYLRLYIFGIGELTGKTYGAYLDIQLAP